MNKELLLMIKGKEGSQKNPCKSISRGIYLRKIGYFNDNEIIYVRQEFYEQLPYGEYHHFYIYLNGYDCDLFCFKNYSVNNIVFDGSQPSKEEDFLTLKQFVDIVRNN